MIMAAQNNNGSDRFVSSSGAIFPLIAKKIIRKGGIVYGAAFDNEFKVKHIGVKNEKLLPCLYGSKYIFSSCKVFPEIEHVLDSGIAVLFSGTPCQCAGLISYLKKDYANLFIIDNICHGAPEAKIWEHYLQEIANGRKVRNVSFRNKEKGWRHYRCVISFEDGTEYNVDHDNDLYMRGFIDNLTLREPCFHCAFKGINNRKSDITLGDFWGVWDYAPDMFDDKGTSVIFINSDKGFELIHEIQNEITYREISEEIAIKNNMSAVKVSKPNFFREAFLKEIERSGEVVAALQKYTMPGNKLKLYRKLHFLIEGNSKHLQ